MPCDADIQRIFMKMIKMLMVALLLITAGFASECMAESRPDTVSVAESTADAVSVAESTPDVVSVAESAPDAVSVAESMADAVSMAESTVDAVSMNENGIYTVTFDDKEMDYFRFGNENGPKVVILPGVSLKSLMGAKDAVTNAYSLLAKDYDVYLFDRIRVFPEDYDVYAMADDTLRAIRAAGLHDVRIMGVSQGSMMAMVMAVRDPELVHSIMLCNSAARIADSAVFETWKKLAEERNTPALLEAFGEYVYTPSFFEKYKEQIIASGEGASEQEYENFIISVGAAASFDWYDHLQEITCPALVIGASEDRVLGVEASYELIEQLECESFIYEGYGHGVYDEAPDFLTHIKAFLDEYKGPETVSNSDSGADESARTVPGTH